MDEQNPGSERAGRTQLWQRSHNIGSRSRQDDGSKQAGRYACLVRSVPRCQTMHTPPALPYLAHEVYHHGQATLVPPENMGRIRREGRHDPSPQTACTQPLRHDCLLKPSSERSGGARATHGGPAGHEVAPRTLVISAAPPSYAEATENDQTAGRRPPRPLERPSPLPAASSSLNVVSSGAAVPHPFPLPSTMSKLQAQSSLPEASTSPHYSTNLSEPLKPHPTSSSDLLPMLSAHAPSNVFPALARDRSEDVLVPPPGLPLTDLDLLLSRLETHENYEDLLVLGELIGPAHASPRTCIDELDIPIGRVEVERRRVTKQGRMKLKLSLLGLAVDRCGICQSQFREQDAGVVLQPCRHAFHERCVRSWLVRSQTCPMCRAVLARVD